MAYPLAAACFYYLLLWHEKGKPVDLGKSLIACGLAFLVKSSAMVSIAVICACITFNILSRRRPLSSVVTGKPAAGWIFLAVCYLLNLGKAIYTIFFLHVGWYERYLGNPSYYDPPQDYYFSLKIDSLVGQPFVTWKESSIWAAQLKTALFNERDWSDPLLGSILMVLFLLMLCYIVVYIVTMPREKCIAYFPFLAAIILSFASEAAYMNAIHVFQCMNFRYIYPVLVPLIILFMFSVDAAKQNKLLLLHHTGKAFPYVMSALSLLFCQLRLY